MNTGGPSQRIDDPTSVPAGEPPVDPVPMDARAIAALFQRQQPRVYRQALRILRNPSDAEEATQEVFVRALRGATTFQEQSLPTTWLHRITTNYCLNLIRDRRRRAELDEGRELLPSSPLGADDRYLLRTLLAGADEQQARAVLYVHLDGLSHDEAARKLGVSRRTVGNLLDRFRAWACADAATPALAA